MTTEPRGRYRPPDFLRALAAEVRERLPVERQGFLWRQRGGLVQFWYEHPRLHFEVWFHRRIEHLEVGLHFEADRPTNVKLLEFFDEHLLIAKADISERVEAEQWDRGWTRVYEMLPLRPLDDVFLDEVADRLTSTVTVLQPLLEAALVGIGPPGAPETTDGPPDRGRWRRRSQRSGT